MYKKQEEVISKTKTPLTKTDIIKGLKDLGVKSDSFVEVHTKVSSFGYIVNKFYDICEALIETVDKGVIIMPAHTSERTNPANWSNPPVPKEWVETLLKYRRPFDRRIHIPERIGMTPQAFLHYPNVKRTNHPVVSLAVLNNTGDASWLDHSLDDRDFIHPLFKLQKSGGKILFLGTDFTTCTSIHLSEQFSPYAERIENENAIIDDSGQIKKVMEITYEFDTDKVDNFKEISERYINKYKGTEDYRQVKIGLATCTLIDAKKLYEIALDFHENYRIENKKSD